MKTKITLGLIVVVALAWGLWSLNSHEPNLAPDTGAVEAPSDQSSRSSHATGGSGKLTASPPGPGASTSDPEAIAPPTEQGEILRAQVVDTQGDAVGGVPVSFARRSGGGTAPTYAAGKQVAASDDEGYFEIPRPEEHGRLTVTGGGYVTLLELQVSDFEPADDATIVVSETKTYSGKTVDEDGVPLASVAIAITMDEGLLRGLRPGVARTVTPSWSTVSDESGRFAVDRVGWSEGLTLSAKRDGYESQTLTLEETTDDGIEILMPRIEIDTSSIVGRVVDTEGNAIVGASVFLDRNVTKSDHEGRFVFQSAELTEGNLGEIVAAIHGRMPDRRRLEGIDTAHEEIELVLEGEPLALTGRVLDAAGQPVLYAHVWTVDTERVGDWPTTVEGVIGEQGNAVRSGAHQITASDGRFTLFGLLDHPYQLFISNPATMRILEHGPCTPGGAEVVIQFDDETEETRPVAGRAVNLRGDPVPGVQIFVGRLAPKIVKGRRLYVPLHTLDTPITDEQGEFRFDALCLNGTYLFPSTEDSPGLDLIELSKVADLDHIEILVPAACQLQVILDEDPDQADYVRVVNEQDVPLRLRVDRDGRIMTSGRSPLVDGKTDVIMVDERAHAVVLLKDQQEIRRIPVELTPGETVLVH